MFNGFKTARLFKTSYNIVYRQTSMGQAWALYESQRNVAKLISEDGPVLSIEFYLLVLYQ